MDLESERCQPFGASGRAASAIIAERLPIVRNILTNPHRDRPAASRAVLEVGFDIGDGGTTHAPAAVVRDHRRFRVKRRFALDTHMAIIDTSCTDFRFACKKV